MGIDKQSSAQGTSKSLQRSYGIESMDSDTDCIVASLDPEGIKKWLQDLKPFNCVQTNELNPFLNVTYKPSTLKVKTKLLTN